MSSQEGCWERRCVRLLTKARARARGAPRARSARRPPAALGLALFALVRTALSRAHAGERPVDAGAAVLQQGGLGWGQGGRGRVCLR